MPNSFPPYRVTGRVAWQAAAFARGAYQRPDVCFFSTWDFHLPLEGGCQLIEFNDNGSGFLFAAIISALYHDATALGRDRQIAAPARLPHFEQHIADLMEQEAKALSVRIRTGAA